MANPKIGNNTLEAKPQAQFLAANPIVKAAMNMPHVDRISPLVLMGITRLLDCLIAAFAGLAAYFIYLRPADGKVELQYLTVILVTAFVVPIAFNFFRLYRFETDNRYHIQPGRLVMAWSVIFAGLVVLAFLFKVGESYSRVWLAMWYASGILTCGLIRLLLGRMVKNWITEHRLERRIVIVGGGPECEDLIKELKASKDVNIRICGIFDDRDDKRSPNTIMGYPKLGTVSALIDFARLIRIDLLIVSLPLHAENRVMHMLKKLWILPIDIRLSALSSKLRFTKTSYSYIGQVPLLNIFDRPLADWDNLVKSIEDRILAALLLVLAAPVMVLVALAVKLDSKGPVFFRQKRYGFNNEMIEVYKFRSLKVEASDQTAEKLVSKNDDRVTRVGRFIRATSLDELPQFFNVLRGELSLVGPRPHAASAKAANKLYNDVVDGYFARHKVKPGITGWAQINGWRGNTDTEEKIRQRVKYDLDYIENWSVWFDLYIMLATPIAMIRRENAY